MIDQIKKLFKGKTKKGISLTYKKYLNKNPEIKNYLENLLNENELFYDLKHLIWLIVYDIELSKCKTCGKILDARKTLSNVKFCSASCATSNNETTLKRQQTCLEKYGVDNPWKSNDVKEKIKNTCLEKYGHENYAQTDEYTKKSKETCLKKYGVDHQFKSDMIREKIKNTCLERYNVEYFSQNDTIKNKIRETTLKHFDGIGFQDSVIKSKFDQTMLKKYNTTIPMKDDEIKEKYFQTCLEKYGNKIPLKNESVKEKFYNSYIEKYGFTSNMLLNGWNKILSWSDFVKPLFDKSEYKGMTFIYKWKCVKCGNEFESLIYSTHHLISFGANFERVPRCLKCYPFNVNTSNSEKELVEFCKQYFPNLKENNRQLIKPLELDIVIDELKLAIEFNGSFYHSVQKDFGVPLGYHLNKVLKCNSVGYRLIHIWEDEWNYNKELIKQKLIDIFTNNETIDYNQKLDRSWYNNLSGNFEEISPEIIIRDGFEVENCGYLKYTI